MRLVGQPRDLTGTLEACKLGAPLSGYEARAIGQELDGARKRIEELEQQVKARGAANALLERDLQVVEGKYQQACWAGWAAQREAWGWSRRYWNAHKNNWDLIDSLLGELVMARAELKASDARRREDELWWAELAGEFEEGAEMLAGLLEEIAERINSALKLQHPLGAQGAVEYLIHALRARTAELHQVRAALEVEMAARDQAEEAGRVLALAVWLMAEGRGGGAGKEIEEVADETSALPVR